MKSKVEDLPTTYASIRFKGADLAPDRVTALMHTQPTLSYRKGDIFVAGKSKETQHRRHGIWIHSTRNLIKSHKIKDHISFIEELLIRSVSIWQGSQMRLVYSFIEEYRCEMLVSLYWHGPRDAKMPEVSRSFLGIVATAGGAVETDFHRDDDVEARIGLVG